MRTCLDACRVHCGDGISQFQHATDLVPGIALVDVYAAIKSYSTAAGKWDLSTSIPCSSLERGAKKYPGCIWIVVNTAPIYRS